MYGLVKIIPVCTSSYCGFLTIFVSLEIIISEKNIPVISQNSHLTQNMFLPFRIFASLGPAQIMAPATWDTRRKNSFVFAQMATAEKNARKVKRILMISTYLSR